MQVDSISKEVDKNGYLCAFCHFIFSTKSGYMEHTKLGNCVQVSKFLLKTFYARDAKILQLWS